MYNAFYRLAKDPFRLTPDPEFLYVTAQHREALAGLVHSACNRSGLTVLAGEAGCGKTMLLHVLKIWLEKRHFRIAFCTNPTLTREELLDLLLFQLGVTCSSPLKNRRLVALEEALQAGRAAGKRAIVIVDEAHALTHELLEEIRLLLNLETSQEKLLDIIIAGQPELMEALRRPELRQLKQRVTCFCKLEPLTLAETREYINHRFAEAGIPQQDIFPEVAISLVFECTQGVPRLINTLCDAALRTGFALESRRVTTSIVHEAARDLDLMPSVSAEDLFPTHSDTTSFRGSLREMEAADDDGRDSYAARQKSVGVLAGLFDRWRS